MLLRIVLFLADTVCSFFTLALLVRFLMQWLRAPFRNPVGQFILAVSDWMVRPLRRVIPGLFGLDMTSLFLAWLWQVAYLGLALGFSGMVGSVVLAPSIGVLVIAALELLKLGIYVVFGAVLVAAIFSWVNPYAPMAEVFNAVTRPLLRPFRRWIPPVGGIDLSPLALLVLLQIALIVLDGLRRGLLPGMM